MPNTREKLEVIAHLGDHITYKEDIGICYDSALAKVIEDSYMELKNGVTVLPCKIGDEFWTDYVGITKVKCSMLTQKADGSWKGRFSVDNGWGSSVNVSLDEIGKTLFKTKEEAEEHLPQPPKGE